MRALGRGWRLLAGLGCVVGGGAVRPESGGGGGALTCALPKRASFCFVRCFAQVAFLY